MGEQRVDRQSAAGRPADKTHEKRQFEKALPPIAVTESGIIISVSNPPPEDMAKELLPIVVSVDGRRISVFAPPSICPKTQSGIFVTPSGIIIFALFTEDAQRKIP